MIIHFRARATRDIDLTLRTLKALPSKSDTQQKALLTLLREESSTDLQDHFVFEILESTMDLDAAPYGGARFPVAARMDGRIFSRFHVDLAVGDFPMEPLEMIQGKDWLGFAGIVSKPFPAIPQEQQFAEKLHAYTRPRTRSNSRVRDLIDLVLLINSGRTSLKLTHPTNRSLWTF